MGSIINQNKLNRKGLLLLLSGPSGAGKGTVIKDLMAKYDNVKYSISVTTRAMRSGEAEGINYYYKSVEEFSQMAASGEFLESEEVYGNYYGTLRSFVEQMTEQGVDVLLEIDTKGAMHVKDIMPDAVMIFLLPKDKATLSGRLINRATETAADLSRRLASAESEIQRAVHYDYMVINDDVNVCSDDILTIINAEKCKLMNCGDFIRNFGK